MKIKEMYKIIYLEMINIRNGVEMIVDEEIKEKMVDVVYW